MVQLTENQWLHANYLKLLTMMASRLLWHLSDFGYSRLVTRSEDDSELALLIWARPEIPREYLLTLFETASETVRQKFETADRGKADLVREMIKQAAEIQTQLRDHSSKFAEARAYVEQLHRNGELNVAQVCKFANSGSLMRRRRHCLC